MPYTNPTWWNPGSPTLIQDREGSAALYVLMPMRV